MSDSTDKPAFKPSAPVSPGSILRSAFDKLTPADRARAMREGWTVRDDPETARKPPTISRAAFDKMPVLGQQMYLGRGGVIAE